MNIITVIRNGQPVDAQLHSIGDGYATIYNITTGIPGEICTCSNHVVCDENGKPIIKEV